MLLLQYEVRRELKATTKNSNRKFTSGQTFSQATGLVISPTMASYKRNMICMVILLRANKEA